MPERIACGYCNAWNQEHPEAEQRYFCGPCNICQSPGHIGAHPRQPVSLCLCQQHWDELNTPGYHFELSHLIYVAIIGLALVQIYPLLARWWGG